MKVSFNPFTGQLDVIGSHASSHQNAGSDEISVDGLSGLLADDQHVLDAEVLAIAQPLDASLTSIALLGTAADKMLYTTDVDTWAEAAITAAGRAMIAGANAAAQLALLEVSASAVEVNQLDGNTFVTDVSIPTELGSELAPALTGASGVNWTFGAGWTTPLDGTLDKASDGTGTMTPTAASSIVAGRTYKVVITASALIVGSCRVKLGNVDLIPITAATTYTQYITASTTANLILTPYTSTSRFTISAVSVKELDNTLGNLDIDGDLTVKSRILNASGVQVANLSPTTRAGYGWNGITFFGNTTFKNGYSFFRGGIQVAGSPIILMDSNDLYENYLWVNNTAAYWLTNESNRQIIIHDRIIGFGKNFDHSAQANPTLFIHSITNPDTSNFEWGSLAFVGTGSGGGYFKLATGVGDISLSPVGNLLLGSVTSPATMVNGVGWASGTAPTADVADQISIHVEDIAAGHAALHIRNENSTIVKLYQQAHITDAPGDTAANNATTINAILTALENNGLLASA